MIGSILLRLKPVGSILIFFLWPVVLLSQALIPPAVRDNYSGVTSYEKLSDYVHLLDKQSGLLTVEVLGKSVQGRDLYAMKFSSSKFGKDTSKIRVLIFAQQHGNEQSGKEGALLLASELLKAENRYLFDRIDLLLVPQVNPDGSELNVRRNANNMDLNRNHLILTEPETQALHKLFDKYLFEVTMDVHEYSPYSEEWKEYGYRKNSDITVGATTNPNVSPEIRDLSGRDYLPYIFTYLRDRGFSCFEYCPGGPPGINYIRHSTFDINDGRQSLGILNTFSFIQEGMNGSDDFIENLRHRTEGQCAGMRGLLEYAYQNKDKIQNLVSVERQKLISGNAGDMISIQSEHVPDGGQLRLPLHSYATGKDTVVMVEDYHPVVKSLYDVQRPEGYLIPKSFSELVAWTESQNLLTGTMPEPENLVIEQFMIVSIDSIDFEGDPTVNPKVKTQVRDDISTAKYLYIPTAQLKGNLVILALEPKSTLGLATYKAYAHLLKTGGIFPVMRVVQKTTNSLFIN